MRDLISKDTGITISVVLLIAGGVWWAATVQTQLTYVQRDVVEIKALLTRQNGMATK